MKIAFDVKGTIEGPKQKQVLELFSRLQAAGHEMIVWSNLFSYATDAIKKYKLNAIALQKYSKHDAIECDNLIDVAIEDDETQTWLGASKIILVSELNDKTEFLINQLGDVK